MKTIVSVFALLLATGCAGSFEESRGIVRIGAAPEVTSRCASLDNRHQIWGGVGKGATFLGGASGVTSVLVKSDDLRTGLALGAVGASAVGVTAIFVSEAAATSWSRECSK